MEPSTDSMLDLDSPTPQNPVTSSSNSSDVESTNGTWFKQRIYGANYEVCTFGTHLLRQIASKSFTVLFIISVIIY